MTDRIWWMERGEGPLVATAVHDGHEVRDEVAELMAISEDDRLREEDPYTAAWTRVAPTRVVATRSRFEVDLNRPRETAVYRTPEDAWGLQVWRDRVPDEVVERSLAQHDDFYGHLATLYGELAIQHGRFVVLDLHSYNHRREGPGGPEADPAQNPQVNVGTGTLPDRSRWGALIDRFMSDLAAFDVPGGRLDVRENVKFRGGNCGRWAHTTFPEAACVLSVEVKKFFMDEWTGELNTSVHAAVGDALDHAAGGLLEELRRL